jgi:hypothetical protein
MYASARDVMLVFAALATVAIAGSVRAVTRRSTQATASPPHQRSDGTMLSAPVTAETSR